MNGLVAFDIDGVIRDVSTSYRRAMMDTVEHFGGWRPSMADIDALKAEGLWNNDWLGSEELLRRRASAPLPSFDTLVRFFQSRYLGEPAGSGYIASETLLACQEHFAQLSTAGYLWGFVSGASRFSALHVLSGRIGLVDPPLVAMNEAPEKPDPTGLLLLYERIGAGCGRVWYIGDTVADMQTAVRAGEARPEIRFLAVGVLPPHLQGAPAAGRYAEQLRAAGAECVWQSLPDPQRLIGCLPA